MRRDSARSRPARTRRRAGRRVPVLRGAGARWGAALRVAAVLAAAGAIAGCSERDHANPFDPENPATGGQPANLRAVAGDRFVSLSWEDLGIADIVKFEILRREGDGEFVSLTPSLLPPGTRQHTDRTVQSRAPYGYVLASYVRGQAAPLLGAEEPASPGPAVPWVAGIVTGRAWLVAPDARDLVRSAFVSARISDLAIVRETGHVWAADYAGSRLVRLDESAQPQETIVTPPGVAAVAANDDGALVFAGSFDSGVVTGYGAGHAQVWADDSTFTGVEDLAWNEADGSLWVADTGGRLARLDGLTGRRLSLRTGFDRPFALAVTAAGAWLVDAGSGDAVYKISASGDTVLAVWQGLGGPADVAADPQGGCWVVDLTAGQVVRLDDDLTGVSVTVGGLSAPRSVRVDPLTREVWVAESGSGRIARISPDGAIVARVGGLVSPFVLAVAWQPSRR